MHAKYNVYYIMCVYSETAIMYIILCVYIQRQLYTSLKANTTIGYL